VTLDVLVGKAREFAASRDGQDPRFTKWLHTWLAEEAYLETPAQAQPKGRALGAIVYNDDCTETWRNASRKRPKDLPDYIQLGANLIEVDLTAEGCVRVVGFGGAKEKYNVLVLFDDSEYAGQMLWFSAEQLREPPRRESDNVTLDDHVQLGAELWLRNGTKVNVRNLKGNNGTVLVSWMSNEGREELKWVKPGSLRETEPAARKEAAE
jgi:hypothetical protein